MKHNKSAPIHQIVSEAIESHAENFIAGLEAEGYARGSLSTKRTALRRFLLWQRRRPPGSEPDESRVARFLSRSFRLGPKHRCLASTALFGFLGGRSANWTAELGVNPTSATGRPIWRRGPCPLPWQRPQGPMHAVVALRGCHAAGPLALPTASGTNYAGLPNRPGQTHEFGRLSEASGPAHQECWENLPLLAAKESVAAHPQTHHGHGPAASWGRHHRDRPLAGT